MDSTFHSVTLDEDKCRGCINCMKRCPTEAIRVRGGKAKIIAERCIDCGECIRLCPHRAKKAYTDSLDELGRFKYNVALPSPSFYGQFNHLEDVNYVLTALLRIGFNEVYEVAASAEIISQLTREVLRNGNLPRPVISSACPAVVRLIRVRFPSLCGNVLPVLAPVDLSARRARAKAAAKTGLSPADIGVFFISPCPAKVTAARSPIGHSRSDIDGVLSSGDIYLKLIKEIKRIERPEPLCTSGILGIGWASSGGESAGLLDEKYLAADGIENVIKVLEEVEDDKLGHIGFIELNACVGGCVGGVLNAENPFVAKARILSLRKYMPVSQNRLPGPDEEDRSEYYWDKPLEYAPVMILDEDMDAALLKMRRIEDITQSLPGLDCGSCGAPSCRAFAEDVVRGIAGENDCVLLYKEQIMKLVGENAAFSNLIPAPFRNPAAKTAKEDKKE